MRREMLTAVCSLTLAIWLWPCVTPAAAQPIIEACCDPATGACWDLEPADCVAAPYNGVPQGPYTGCVGDSEPDGDDDACDCASEPGEIIVLRSGNGTVGGADTAITAILASVTGPLKGSAFTGADFADACSAPATNIVSLYPGWLTSLPSDPNAQWIAGDPTRSPHAALYCYEFEICCPNIDSATLDFCWAVDDRLGDDPNWPTHPNELGVYVNAGAIPGSSGGGHTSESTLPAVPIGGLLTTGANTLHVYAVDTAYVVSGLMFSATIRVTCAQEACCFTDGSCQDLDPCCCDDLGGIPSPIGEPACLGDLDGNGVDDACDEEHEIVPTVSEWGLVAMTLVLLAAAKVYFGRRRAARA